MKLKKDASDQKLRGAYYTPLKLAEQIISLFSKDDSIRTVLEPSCGDGVFFDALINRKQIGKFSKLLGLELNPDEIQPMKTKYKSYENLEIINYDFFDFYKERNINTKFDLILGNPPYIRYQYLLDIQREEMSEILVSHGMKANKLINAWVGFTVACIHLLSETGKIAFVIPAEILQVAYARDLRKFLVKNLDSITIITFKELVFDDIEQEIVVFIGERNTQKKGIRIIELNNMDSFSHWVKEKSFQKISLTDDKWTKYFTSEEEAEFIESIRQDSKFKKLSDLALINVGITTGDNKYFSLQKNTVEKYALRDVVLPLIGRSSQANSIFFNEDDWKENINKNKAAYLLNFTKKNRGKLSDLQKEYIKLGEEKGCHTGYKCSIRDVWYEIPSVWSPDAFFLRRNNLYPKLVLNCCNAVSTDTMHRIKFNEGVNKEAAILSYYNSISFAFTEICGRSYGGGVLEILPGEVGNIYVPSLDKINSDKIHNLLEEVDTLIRNDSEIEQILDLIDNEILVKELKIEKTLCVQARKIWKKLQQRRLNRGKKNPNKLVK